MKTVFGKCGVVSNVVDLVKVPQQIEQKKREIAEVKDRLNEVDKKLADVSDAIVSSTQTNFHNIFTQREDEVEQLEANLAKMLKAKMEYADIFDVVVNDNMTEQIKLTEIKLKTCQEELRKIQFEYDNYNNDVEAKRNNLQQEKHELQEKLFQLENKVLELKQKINRKHGQLNDNLGKLF